MLHEAGFTQKDLKLLEKFQDLVDRGFKEDLLEKAAVELKMSPITVRTRLSRLRAKHKDNSRFLKDYRHWQQTLYHRTGGRFHFL
jgi:hypothetical protein